MNDNSQRQLGNTLWSIADQLRGAMDADDFRDYMLSFLFLRYLSDNYEKAAKKELGKDYPSQADVEAAKAQLEAERAQREKAIKGKAKAKAKSESSDAEDAEQDARKIVTRLSLWYQRNPKDVVDFEKQMRRKVHYVIEPAHLWNSIVNLARTQDGELLKTLQAGFKYIETESFESAFQGLFSEIDLSSPKLGRTYSDRNAKLCTIIQKIEEGLNEFSTDVDTLGDAYGPQHLRTLQRRVLAWRRTRAYELVFSRSPADEMVLASDNYSR